MDNWRPASSPAPKSREIIAASPPAFKAGTAPPAGDNRKFAAPHKCRQSTCRPSRGKLPGSGSNRRRPLHMPQPNLADLESKHRALEAELDEALAHPSTDDLKL